MQRAVLRGLQIDNVHQVEISCIAQKRRRLLDGEHDAAGDCGACAARRHVGEGGAAGDDEAGFAYAAEIGGGKCFRRGTWCVHGGQRERERNKHV